MKKLPITGFVLAVEGDSVLLRITGLLSKRDTEWVRRPTNIPKWATFGIGFKAKMPESVNCPIPLWVGQLTRRCPEATVSGISRSRMFKG